MSALEAEKTIEASTREKALVAAKAALEKRGTAVTIIDLTGRCSYTDALVVVSATSERQAGAIGQAIEDALRADFGMRPVHREPEGSWVLLDFGELYAHVFQEEARAYYDIDRLWSDAPRVPVPALAAPVPAEAGPSALARRRKLS